jgi:hypothetical protein
MGTLLHLARWIAWQVGDHTGELYQPAARITVFSSTAD